jgi:hypothetical protein
VAPWGASPAAAETLDRVVASVGNIAITTSDVEKEYRYELLLEAKLPAPVPDAATLDRVRDRLVEQQLLKQEADAEGIERADLPQGAKQALSEVRRQYPSDEAYQTALGALGITEEQVLGRLEEQAVTIRVIDQRLRPAAWVERSEIETYYTNTFVPELSRQSTSPAPPLDEVEAQIREILVQQKIDRLLATWLGELKAVRRVRLHSF